MALLGKHLGHLCCVHGEEQGMPQHKQYTAVWGMSKFEDMQNIKSLGNVHNISAHNICVSDAHHSMSRVMMRAGWSTAAAICHVKTDLSQK